MWQDRNPLSDAKRASDRGEVVFSENATFHGTLKCDAPVYIFGRFDGELETTASVVVGKNAQVVADIRAHDVGIAGAVVGNIVAEGRVEVYAGGRAYGDVVASGLKIEDGAVFSGQSTMPQKDTDPFLRTASHQLRLVEGAR
jgi:cytoskeletal protein CcmA (bactofilin family)